MSNLIGTIYASHQNNKNIINLLSDETKILGDLDVSGNVDISGGSLYLDTMQSHSGVISINNNTNLMISTGGGLITESISTLATNNEITVNSTLLAKKGIVIDGSANDGNYLKIGDNYLVLDNSGRVFIKDLSAQVVEISGGTIDNVDISGADIIHSFISATPIGYNRLGQVDASGAVFTDISANVIITNKLVASEVEMNGGGINGVPIGSTQPDDASFNNVTVYESFLAKQGLTIDGSGNHGNYLTVGDDYLVVSEGSVHIRDLSAQVVEISGGTIDNVDISGADIIHSFISATPIGYNRLGQVDASGAVFTDISANVIITNKLVASEVEMNGGGINGVPIGSTQPDDASFNNVTVYESFLAKQGLTINGKDTDNNYLTVGDDYLVVNSQGRVDITDLSATNITLQNKLILDPSGSYIKSQTIDNSRCIILDPYPDHTDENSKDASGIVIIQGDLQVKGTTTTLHSQELVIHDNIITLNKGLTQNFQVGNRSGIDINLGGEVVSLHWDNIEKRWTIGDREFKAKKFIGEDASFGTVDISENLTVFGDTSFNQNVYVGGELSVDNLNVNGGGINGVPIGGTQPADASFNNLTVHQSFLAKQGLTIDGSGNDGNYLTVGDDYLVVDLSGRVQIKDLSASTVDICGNLTVFGNTDLSANLSLRSGNIDFYQSNEQIVTSDPDGILNRLNTLLINNDDAVFNNVDVNGNLTIDGNIDTNRVDIIGTSNGDSGSSNTLFNIRDNRTASGNHNHIFSIRRPNSDTSCLILGNNANNQPLIIGNNADIIFGNQSGSTFTENMRLINTGNLEVHSDIVFTRGQSKTHRITAINNALDLQIISNRTLELGAGNDFVKLHGNHHAGSGMWSGTGVYARVRASDSRGFFGSHEYANDSDDRLKFNETLINNGLILIRQLTPQKYDKSNVLNVEIDTVKEAGFIAQDILLINDLSWCVKGGNFEASTPDVSATQQPYSLCYQSLSMYHIAATKELDVIVQSQQTEINNLKTENTLLKSKLNELLSEAGKQTI